jgi:hypothetical protein
MNSSVQHAAADEWLKTGMRCLKGGRRAPVHAEALQRILVSFRHDDVKTEHFPSSRAKEIATDERGAIRIHKIVHLVVTTSNLLVVRATVRGSLGPVVWKLARTKRMLEGDTDN